jgi:hypothetical protein
MKTLNEQVPTSPQLTFSAFALLALSFVIRPLAGALGFVEPEDPVQATFQQLGAVLVLAGIAWVATKGRGPAASLKGYAWAGAIASLGVLAGVYNDHKEQQAGVAFISSALLYEERAKASFLALNAQIEVVDFRKVSNQAALVDPAARAAALAETAKLRALIAKRVELAKQNSAEVQKLVDEAQPGTVKDTAGAAMAEGTRLTNSVLAELDAAQLAHLKLVDGMLTWSETAGLRLVGGQMAPADKVAELNAQKDKIADAEKQLQALFAKADQVGADYARKDAELKAKWGHLLNNKYRL